MFREEIFKSVSKSALPGVIFTFVMAFNQKEDWEDSKGYVTSSNLMGDVELEAELEGRIIRNKTLNKWTVLRSRNQENASIQFWDHKLGVTP
jgi:hypothetical protein